MCNQRCKTDEIHGIYVNVMEGMDLLSTGNICDILTSSELTTLKAGTSFAPYDVLCLEVIMFYFYFIHAGHFTLFTVLRFCDPEKHTVQNK
jgi:hypothetical protein